MRSGLHSGQQRITIVRWFEQGSAERSSTSALKVGEVQIVEATSDLSSTSENALDSLHGAPRPDVQQSLSSLHGSEGAESSGARAEVTGLVGLCGLVWQLRGWAHYRLVPRIRNCLQHTASSDGTDAVVILSRSDGRPAPTWDEIVNVREGRERLGYNPAVEIRDISKEDLYAVQARRGDRLGQDVVRSRLRVKGGDRAALARL